jgi:hypothetical protein
MIEIALNFIKDELNTYLYARTGSDRIDVNLSKVVDESGKYAFTENSIAATVINIEEERTFKSQLPEYKYQDGQHIRFEPDIKLNLHILFSAYFQLYYESLKAIAHILTYFQSHTFFTPIEYPALDARIERLVPQLESVSYEQLNQIWAFIGAKQLPSVIYNVRLVVIQDNVQSEIIPPLTKVVTNMHRL